MVINKIYEVVCDECGKIYYSHATSKLLVENDYIRVGGVVEGKKQFCNVTCERAFNRKTKG